MIMNEIIFPHSHMIFQMWVTVLAVADLPPRWAAVMQNTGVFFFAVAAHYNRFSVWLFAAPIIIGMTILVGHWVRFSKNHSKILTVKV